MAFLYQGRAGAPRSEVLRGNHDMTCRSRDHISTIGRSHIRRGVRAEAGAVVGKHPPPLIYAEEALFLWRLLALLCHVCIALRCDKHARRGRLVHADCRENSKASCPFFDKSTDPRTRLRSVAYLPCYFVEIFAGLCAENM